MLVKNKIKKSFFHLNNNNLSANAKVYKCNKKIFYAGSLQWMSMHRSVAFPMNMKAMIYKDLEILLYFFTSESYIYKHTHVHTYTEFYLELLILRAFSSVPNMCHDISLI